MQEFSNAERSLFLRFVWGRTRLPRTIADFRGRDFVLQVMNFLLQPKHLNWSIDEVNFLPLCSTEGKDYCYCIFNSIDKKSVCLHKK